MPPASADPDPSQQDPWITSPLCSAGLVMVAEHARAVDQGHPGVLQKDQSGPPDVKPLE